MTDCRRLLHRRIKRSPTATFFLPYPEDFAPILPTLEYYKQGERHRPLPLE